MNRYQERLAQVYGGGDYAHLVDEFKKIDTVNPAHVKAIEIAQIKQEVGDTLFLFCWLELEDDCDTGKDEFIQRMHRAKDDLDVVIAGLEMLE